jgi:hypothetical protein
MQANTSINSLARSFRGDHCWRKAGILPSASSAITAAIFADLETENEAESALTQVLDDLHSRGVLQTANRLNVADLVMMPDEQVMEDASEEEIFGAVQKMRSDEENIEVNAGDDGDDSPQDPTPTRKEALQAVSTLQKYLQEEDGTFARKLELALATFGRETRLEQSKQMITTSITDYFITN